MDDVRSLFVRSSRLYNSGSLHYDACKATFFRAHQALTANATYSYYGSFMGNPVMNYNVFASQDPLAFSRPVRPDLYLSDTTEFVALEKQFVASLGDDPKAWTDGEKTIANRVVYTAVMSVACCYDLWQRRSRKSPGTFFEILTAGALQIMLPDAVLTKHIALAALVPDKDVQLALGDSEREPEIVSATGEENSIGSSGVNASDDPSGVSTDLVVGIRGEPGGIVVPLKITTRERIVQPFAHQRILDSAFGEGVYKSLITCISETQLDENSQSVKQVCVPGTVKLFQKHLARIDGLYYCDVPQRYAAEDMKRTINVKSVGDLFVDIATLLEQYKTT